jgi:hypothetical protein
MARYRPEAEALESRLTPAANVALQGGLLLIQGDALANVVTVQNSADGRQVNVVADGVLSSFDAAAVQRFAADLGPGDDDFTSRLDLPGTILGGDGADSLQSFNRVQRVSIFGGRGNDSIYSIVGPTDVVGGPGRDKVTTNALSTLDRDPADFNPVIFGLAQTPGFSLIGGVLYYVPFPGGDNQVLISADSAGNVLALASLNGQPVASQVFARGDFDSVASVLGPGNDSFSVRVPGLKRVVLYGAGGADALSAGRVKDALLKGGGGNDTLDATGAGSADLSGDPGADVLLGGGRTVFRTDPFDLVAPGRRDRVVSQ